MRWFLPLAAVQISQAQDLYDSEVAFADDTIQHFDASDESNSYVSCFGGCADGVPCLAACFEISAAS